MSDTLTISFFNDYQHEHFNCTQRNSCFSGGFGNGKTYEGCQKALLLLLTFPGYRFAIVRKSYADLKKTTQQTFFKLLPGGANGKYVLRHSEQDGITDLFNGSRVYWLHSDKFDEGTLRGLEVNSVLIDQGEELEENIYLILDARVGRWDRAEVPNHMLTEDWPTHPKTGRPLVPNYMMILCNPEHTLHWIYQRYHPDSESRQPDHWFITAPTDPNSYDPHTYAQMLRRDPEWVSKYIKGEWGTSEAQIHNLLPDSILKEVPADFLSEVVKKGALYRVLDHGDSAPTCCVWFSCYKGAYFAYREYYMPHEVISNHRKNISDLSGKEYYVGNYADPQIFKMENQKYGGFWSVADEYMDNQIQAPPLFWNPADNNEFANRNRINELLAKDPAYAHPINGTLGAPRFYFIMRSEEYPNGISQLVPQIKAARRELLGTLNGKNYYGDERSKSIEDHAYDCLRYFVSIHGSPHAEPKRPVPPGSFMGVRKAFKLHRRIAALMN